SLMGCVHVNWDMRDQVSARDARYDDKQFFSFAVYKPLLEVGSLRVVVVPFEGLHPAHRRNEVVQAVPKASERRRPLQFSLQIRSHRTPPSLYVKSIRTTPISNPLLPAKERPSPEFHHPVNGRDVGAERGTPSLKTLGLVHAASPPSHKVQHLHDLLRGRPGLMGRMHVDLQVGHQVSLGHTGYY